jgi:hypothetical protein
LANRAAVPRTGGRFRHGTKRTHLEIEVKEIQHNIDKKSKKNQQKVSPIESKQKSKLSQNSGNLSYSSDKSIHLDIDSKKGENQ